MQKGNIGMMSATAVVIVVVLLASWAWYDEDDDRAEARTEVSVGDTMTYEFYDANGYYSTTVQTVYAIEGDTVLIVSDSDEGFVDRTLVTNMDMAGIVIPESALGDVIGNETIDTPFGEKECQIRQYMNDGILFTGWFADNNVSYKATYPLEDGTECTIVLTETSLFDEAPGLRQAEAFAGIDTQPAVGMGYTQTLVSFNGNVPTALNLYYYVLENDGDTVTVDVWDDLNSEDVVQMGLDEFNSLWTACGSEYKGTETLVTAWGLIDADVTYDIVDNEDGTSTVTTYWNESSGVLLKTEEMTVEDGVCVDSTTTYVVQNDAVLH